MSLRPEIVTLFKIAYGLPILAVVMMPLVTWPFSRFHKSRRYKRAMKRTDVAEYSAPRNLNAAELGYIFDEKSGGWEILSSKLALASKGSSDPPITDYEHVAQQLPLDYLLKNVHSYSSNSVRQTDNNYSKEELGWLKQADKYNRYLHRELMNKKIMGKKATSMDGVAPSVKVANKLFMIFMLPMYVVIAAAWVSEGADTSFGSTDDKGLSGLAIMVVVGVVINWFGIYMAARAYHSAVEQGPLLALRRHGVDRSLWDEVRGYREFLEQVEASRAEALVASKNASYVNSEVFRQLVALGFVSPDVVRAAFDVDLT